MPHPTTCKPCKLHSNLSCNKCNICNVFKLLQCSLQALPAPYFHTRAALQRQAARTCQHSLAKQPTSNHLDPNLSASVLLLFATQVSWVSTSGVDCAFLAARVRFLGPSAWPGDGVRLCQQLSAIVYIHLLALGNAQGEFRLNRPAKTLKPLT